MNDALEIVRMMAEGGFTWQETIIISLALTGATLSVLIIVRGGVALVARIMETFNIALQKINIRRVPKE